MAALNSERFLIDQTLDHELECLLHVLTHNLKIVGYPLDNFYDAITLKSWNPYLESMEALTHNMIGVTDPLGCSYLLPCLAVNPTMTRSKRKAHKHFYVKVLADTAQSYAQGQTQDHTDNKLVSVRTLTKHIDFD